MTHTHQFTISKIVKSYVFSECECGAVLREDIKSKKQLREIEATIRKQVASIMEGFW